MNFCSELEPNVALKFQPHIPAYILFMCIRYTDYNNDDLMVSNLFLQIIKKYSFVVII